MKKIIAVIIATAILFTLSAVPSAADTQFSQTASQFVGNIKAGWNLGNTFENTGKNYSAEWDDSCTVTDIETAAKNPVTTQAIIDEVARAGFNAVRIPISWYRFADAENNFKIRDDWFNRILEVVGYCYKNDMYVIVNMHHDDKAWLDITKNGDDWESVRLQYKAIWSQIADRFKDYDDHLILEAGNEIIAGNDWWGQSSSYFKKINQIYSDFIEIVRNSGGNNDKRYVMLPTYGAQWYEHQWGSLDIPDDHCIVDIHWYSESADVVSCEQNFKPIYDKLVSKGTAVVVGETGIRVENKEKTKLSWANAYYYTATKYKIPVFIWDDGGWYKTLDRKTLKWTSDGLIDEIQASLNGKVPTTVPQPSTTAYQPITDNPNDYEPTSDVFYAWSTLDYAQTEGWQAGAVNQHSVGARRAVGGIRFDLAEFKSQQLNSNWKIPAEETDNADTAMKKAQAGSGYLIFTVKVDKARNANGQPCMIKIKHNIAGSIPDNLAPTVSEGQTLKILIRANENYNTAFFVQFQNFEETLTQLDVTISKISVAQKIEQTSTTSIETDTDIPTITTTQAATQPTTTARKAGDFDGDNSVTILDAQAAVLILANGVPSEILPWYDVNGDGGFSLLDIRQLVLNVLHNQ